MEFVFLLGTIQAVFLAALVLIKKNKMLADKVMVAWLFFMGLHLFDYYLEVTGVADNYLIFKGFSVSFPMLEGAFTFVYVSLLTSKIQKLQWKHLIHVSHYLIFTIIVFYIAIKNNILMSSESVGELEGQYTSVFFYIGIFNVFLGPVYLLMCLYKLRKHKKNIASNFSYTEEIDLKWLKYVVIIMAVVWIVVIITNVLGNYNDIIPYRLGDNIIFTTVTLAVFLYGFFGIKQQVIYAAPKAKVTEPSTEKVNDSPINQYQKSGLKKEDSENHLKQLLNYMEKEAPYLDGKLSLKDVAAALEISTNHLSQVINENLEKNFFDFVNGYRVDLVKEKMSNPSNSNFTLLALAYDCGFNSKSSFNSIFKKYTKLTPSQYLDTL